MRRARRATRSSVTAAVPASLALLAALPVLLAAPAGAGPTPPPPPTPQALAAAAYARMTPAQRVGQLFLIGLPSTGATPAQRARLAAAAGGNVFLRGHTAIGRAAVARVVGALVPSATEARVRPFVAVDQEGGEVQGLSGTGFSVLPTALDQGRVAPATLQRQAQVWGAQLRAAGVNLDLAPVADTVPRAVGTANQPIGRYLREYGYTVTRVREHVVPIVRGLAAAHVATAAKHFPGLGRASGNTDDSHGVTDPTGPHDYYLAPFTEAISAGTQFVMVSSATYPTIDRYHKACFSTTVIRTVLRGYERFHGIVVSDSVAATALSYVPVADRATRFFAAGGTMLLDTDPDDLVPMTRAVLAEAASSPAFATTIRSAVLLVLTTKARDGLVSA